MIYTPMLFLLALSVLAADARARKPETLTAWICRVLRIDPTVYAKLVGVRSVPSQTGGNRLVMANLEARTETVLYDCGTCWSPAVVGSDRVAFLRTDGVWMIPLSGGTPRLIAPATGLRVLVGQTSAQPDEFVVLRHDASDAACEYRLEIANFVTGKLALSSDGRQCVAEAELGAVIRSGSLRDKRVLVSSQEGAGTRRILIGDLSGDGDLRNGARTPLLPWIDAREDGIDRFDAVWIDGSHIIYVQKS
jgi:hypothetical protein